MKTVYARIKTIPHDGFPSKAVDLFPMPFLGDWRDHRAEYEFMKPNGGMKVADAAEFVFRFRIAQTYGRSGDSSKAVAALQVDGDPYLLERSEIVSIKTEEQDAKAEGQSPTQRSHPVS